jgi:drug/metabolite transporter (DMT)-like permease
MNEAGQVAAQRRGVMLGIAAAALFGCSPPIAKLLLPRVGLLPLSGLLYLGAGLALTLAQIVRRASGGRSREAPLRPRDWSLLFAVVVFGGVVGPILMLLGLSRLSALAGSLLLNLEAPFTIAIAVLFFREHLGARQTLGAAGIILGAMLLGQQPGGFSGDWRGTFAVAAACLCWAIDNNLSQRLSLRDPVAVVQVKGLGAGACVLLIALATRAPFPSAALTAAALLVGAFSYGLSLVLNMQALRVLGAARQAAIFATAPFIGAVLSVPLLGDRPNLLTFLAGALMITGIAALILERHRHLHRHEPLEHEHLHVHDEHHQHRHLGPVTEPHSHPHVHAPLVHDHPHVPDLHHRHPHR